MAARHTTNRVFVKIPLGGYGQVPLWQAMTFLDVFGKLGMGKGERSPLEQGAFCVEAIGGTPIPREEEVV